MKKKILYCFAVLVVIVIMAFHVGVRSSNNLSDTMLINAEALATPGDDWRAGFTTGEITITVEGVDYTIPCCVPSSATNACNYGEVSCITSIA